MTPVWLTCWTPSGVSGGAGSGLVFWPLLRAPGVVGPVFLLHPCCLFLGSSYKQVTDGTPGHCFLGPCCLLTQAHHFPFCLNFNVSIIDTQRYVSFRCTAWWFDKFMHDAVPATHGHHKSQHVVTVSLTAFLMLCFSFPWLTHSVTGGLCLPLPWAPFTHPSIPFPLASVRLFPVVTPLLPLLLLQDFIYEQIHIVFVSFFF